MCKYGGSGKEGGIRGGGMEEGGIHHRAQTDEETVVGKMLEACVVADCVSMKVLPTGVRMLVPTRGNFTQH